MAVFIRDMTQWTRQQIVLLYYKRTNDSTDALTIFSNFFTRLFNGLNLHKNVKYHSALRKGKSCLQIRWNDFSIVSLITCRLIVWLIYELIQWLINGRGQLSEYIEWVSSRNFLYIFTQLTIFRRFKKAIEIKYSNIFLCVNKIIEKQFF